MKKRMASILILLIALLLPQTAFAWNNTGHQLVARIAWENMTPAARRNVISLLRSAPRNACLRQLFPNDSRPVAEREREFFMLAATWPDIVRAGACRRFHRQQWHFINFPWSGTSGSTSDPPTDRPNIPIAQVNAVERLVYLRAEIEGTRATRGQKAINLAWILHLVGDIHQPLHTSGRLTSRANERLGDRGGNNFKLGPGTNSTSLHSYWDGIINRSIRRQRNESDEDYFERVANIITSEHPQASLSGRLISGQFEAWAREGVQTAKSSLYPASLQRGRMPGDGYRQQAFETSKEAIALAGYRLADLLNQLFG